MPHNGALGISCDWQIPGMGGGGGHYGANIPKAVENIATRIRESATPGTIRVVRYIIGKSLPQSRQFTADQFLEFRGLLSQQELPDILLEFSDQEFDLR